MQYTIVCLRLQNIRNNYRSSYSIFKTKTEWKGHFQPKSAMMSQNWGFSILEKFVYKKAKKCQINECLHRYMYNSKCNHDRETQLNWETWWPLRKKSVTQTIADKILGTLEDFGHTFWILYPLPPYQWCSARFCIQNILRHVLMTEKEINIDSGGGVWV